MTRSEADWITVGGPGCAGPLAHEYVFPPFGPGASCNRQPVTVADPAKHQEAVSRRQAMPRQAEADTPTLGEAFIRGVSGTDAPSKLSRYEASVERSYYRAV